MMLSSQRTALCDALDAVEESSPTLRDGWTAHSLAAHVWLRENDPTAALGIVVPPWNRLTEQRMSDVVAERPYADLVADIRRGPARWSPFRLPGAEAAANTIEFFVHCEDVRRGTGVNTPRPTDPRFENLAWKRAIAMARLVLRKAPVAVWLERDVPPGDPVRIGKGPDIVTLSGPPSEILLYLFGRRSAAQVEVTGQPAAVSALGRFELGV